MRPLLILLLIAFLGGCALPFASAPPPPPSPEPPTTTPAPTPLPSLGPLIEVPGAGFAIAPPIGWTTAIVSDTLSLAPNQAALERRSSGSDLVLTIDATPLSVLADQFGPVATRNPEGFFTASATAAQAAGYQVGPPTPQTFANAPGLVADLSAPGGAGRLAVILGPDVAVRVLGQSDADSWPAQAELYAAILASLSFLPPPTPTPLPREGASQPPVLSDGPEGFVLRLGGQSGPPEARFVAARGLAVAPDGTLYLAESRRGVWVFAPDGTLIRTFGEQDLLDAYDLARTAEGDLLVADFGRNAIVRFRPDGSFVERWGSPGDAPDQFGLASPQRIAIGADGVVYALDSRPSPESGRMVSSILRFSATGQPIGRLTLPADVSPVDLAVDAQGAIYIAESFGGVVKLAPDGSEIARFGDPADPQALAAGALDLDRQGNLYLATYTNGVVQLAPSGMVIARGGASAPPGTLPPPGQISLPNGIAAAPGGVVWVSDNSGEYSAITALRLQRDQVAAATAEAQNVPQPDLTPTPVPPPVDLVRQWASEANASSFYAPDYEPAGATGPPDVVGCQDSPNAWASADPNGLEILELRYREPVFAVGVVIHQSYNPGFITQVELLDERGASLVVYTAVPMLASECPQALEIAFEQTLTRINAVRLTIDQRPGANWSEIDAVELIGVR
ncbi:MAG: NHL repeat-containing protein [Oscillochloridaceae bacterium umkhey_bin13]